MNLTRRMLIAIPGLALIQNSVQAQSGTPEVAVEGESDAVELLTNAVRAMAELDTFHFEIETTSGTTEIMGVLEIRKIVGDVRRPWDFQTTITAHAILADVEVQAIGIDGVAWIQDPTGGADSWIRVESQPAILSMLNPDYLFLGAIGILDEVSILGEEQFEDQNTTAVVGFVDFREVAGWLVQDEAGQLLGELAEEPVEVTIWIRDDNLIAGIEFFGAVLASEPGNTARTITFSAYNEPVDIVAPDV